MLVTPKQRGPAPRPPGMHSPGHRSKRRLLRPSTDPPLSRPRRRTSGPAPAEPCRKLPLVRVRRPKPGVGRGGVTSPADPRRPRYRRDLGAPPTAEDLGAPAELLAHFVSGPRLAEERKPPLPRPTGERQARALHPTVAVGPPGGAAPRPAKNPRGGFVQPPPLCSPPSRAAPRGAP